MIGIVQVGEQGHADRYTYLPHIGLFVAMVWFAIDVVKFRRSKPQVPVTTAAAVLIVVALAWAAFVQTSYSRNSETLWTHALAVMSDNDVAPKSRLSVCRSR